MHFPYVCMEPRNHPTDDGTEHFQPPAGLLMPIPRQQAPNGTQSLTLAILDHLACL